MRREARKNYTTACPLCHPVSLAWMTSQLNVPLICKLCNVFGLFFDVLSMAVCTTKHWQTSDQPMQCLHCVAEVNNNIGPVLYYVKDFICHFMHS